MLFDMPPLMANDDSHGFLRSVDCALLVVVAEKTPMEQIDVAERQLSELTNVMGIILNRCRYTTGAHGYENEYY
jgi:Mrp family chromosome partitioning ATPase